MCRRVGMSRQNYYREKRQREREQVNEALVVKLVQRERRQQPQLGGRKLLWLLRRELAEAGVVLGRDRFFGLLRRHGLLVERRRRTARTTASRHGFRVYRNRLKERRIEGPHEAWVSDLTYVRTDEGFLYLSLISDQASRKIVGWEISGDLKAEGSCQALRQAVRQLPKGKRPLHHSDRGIQYCCRDYIGILEKRGLEVSMTEENHCYENGQAERLNGILKQEYGIGGCFRTKAQAREAIRQGIGLYNHRRPHQSLGYRTPEEVHRQAA
jgi:transposase InsO family protein